ncbi:MBL fold metallo-hydrolase [Campylobacter sp. 19-13652]|uniref:MBL fold metallo-hydrolase n=1 Tax=Campylobacter sp. 19-13652 TaxID=2840180 RepID=UPI001C797ED0|nr:MBL fold metallo-hydrolase [Campylobacter sp. 19-13652]BCX79222.1 hydrolase [Campylobacter sp. 19-13652]
MKIFCKAFGDFGTNCYIAQIDNKAFIIDPGVGATKWVLGELKSKSLTPLAILCTHGHFDHINDVADLKSELGAPVYIHKDDEFMLLGGYQFGFKFTPCKPDFAVDEGSYSEGGEEFSYLHFAGHTPGCAMIRIKDVIFSGDFLFKSSIGRWDFEYSNAHDMLKSLQKCADLKGDYTIYPGHGASTTLKAEQANLTSWAEYIRREI